MWVGGGSGDHRAGPPQCRTRVSEASSSTSGFWRFRVGRGGPGLMGAAVKGPVLPAFPHSAADPGAEGGGNVYRPRSRRRSSLSLPPSAASEVTPAPD